MEETLIILKPDCMEKRVAGEVISRFEKAGFEIVASKITQLDGAILREHYAHVADQPFFPQIEAFMSSRSVMPMILSGEDVIANRADHCHRGSGAGGGDRLVGALAAGVNGVIRT